MYGTPQCTRTVLLSPSSVYCTEKLGISNPLTKQQCTDIVRSKRGGLVGLGKALQCLT